MASRSVTREQLYEMIWARAVSKVAPEFGISDVALRKRCRALNIPVPDARYWGRFHAGKSVQRPPLPAAPKGMPEAVVIRSTRRHRSTAVEAALQAAKIEATMPPLPERRDRRIAATIKALSKARQDDNGGVKCGGSGQFVVRAHPDTIQRIGEFLDHFVAAAMARRFPIRDGKSGLEVEVNGELVGFALSQTIRRTRHQPTEEELRRQEQWDRRHANDWASWRNRPTVPHYDFTPTGEMSLEISGWPRPDGVTLKFADSRSRKIEERIPEIFASMAAHAAYQLEWRLEQEARRRRAEEEQARREREEHERQLEQQRVQFLGGVLTRHQEYQAVGRLITALESDEEADASSFLAWAKQRHLGLRSALELTVIEAEARALLAFEASSLSSGGSDA